MLRTDDGFAKKTNPTSREVFELKTGGRTRPLLGLHLLFYFLIGFDFLIIKTKGK